MSNQDEQILRTVKEIVVKFIETGRISPSGFGESFKAIYQAVAETVKGSDQAGGSQSAEGRGQSA